MFNVPCFICFGICLFVVVFFLLLIEHATRMGAYAQYNCLKIYMYAYMYVYTCIYLYIFYTVTMTSTIRQHVPNNQARAIGFKVHAPPPAPPFRPK